MASAWFLTTSSTPDPAFLETIWNQLQQLSILELIATISLVAYVILAARENPWCWPVSMIGVAIYMYLAVQALLYAELVINGYYLIVSAIGFWVWIKGSRPPAVDKDAERKLPVTRATLIEWVVMTSLTGLGIAMGTYLLDTFTDTDVAFWDALTTAVSFAATYMLVRKRLENWLVWIGIDIVYVWLMWYKDYYLFMLLNVFYVCFAFYGYMKWQKSLSRS